MLALADEHGCELIGGDTTQGPLNICITVFGEVPREQALLRSGARAGDDLYVSGTLGDARLALEVFRGQLALPGDAFERVRRRMEQPTPRVALAQALRGVAHSAIDVSDGMLGDLGHVLRASDVGATVNSDWLLDSTAVSADLRAMGDALCLEFALAGGDDYELVFTAPAAQREQVAAAARASGTPVTRIGQINAEPGLRVLGRGGQVLQQRFASFDHFA